MQTTAILNLKGGVGKTTTAVNLAYNLADIHKKRVLLIDADSQGNSTDFFGLSGVALGLADIMRGGDDAIFANLCITHTDYDRLDVIAGGDALMDLDLSALDNKKISSGSIASALANLADDYDFCIIDCPPAFSASSAAALVAATDVIIPIKIDAYSLRGMTNLMRQIIAMQRINPKLRIDGVLATMYYNSPENEDAVTQLMRSTIPVFENKIRRSDLVDGTSFAKEPLQIYSPRCGAGVDYRKFTEEYLEGKA